MRLCQFSNYFTKNSSSFFLKLGKLDREVIVTGREFQIFGPFQISSAMMHAIIVGCSGALAMNLIVCKKQVEKQRQRVVMITVHKFHYLKRFDLINV